MTNKIFVANFPYSTTVEDLSALFEPHGEVVSAKIATDRETGRSRGFGFIEMGTSEQADAAIEGLNGQDMGGRPLAVRIAEDRRGPGGGGGRGGFGGGGGYGGGGRGPGGPGGPRRGGGGGFGGPRRD